MIEKRPRPPEEIFGVQGRFIPAPDLVSWMRSSFIDQDAILRNEDHWHLRYARIGALWTNVGFTRRGKTIVATAEVGEVTGASPWRRARVEEQVRGWFGVIPDFIITVSADYAVRCTDAQFCAVMEHELYHCAQRVDEFGMPKFTSEGAPAFTMKGHDVEEFVGVVRRYGAVHPDIQVFAQAAMAEPELHPAEIAAVCGTCLARAK